MTSQPEEVPDLLDRRPREAVRRLALAHLADAAAAYERLTTTRDAEALHDVRVALRRLRSHLRAYEPLVADTVGPKLLRRLGELARASGPNRDLEVQIEQLGRVAAELSAGERIGLEWLLARLHARRAERDASLLELLAARFGVLHAELRDALRRFTATLDPAEECPATFAEAAAAQVSSHADEFRRRVEALRAAGGARPAHRARIATKRLRYLLEPLARVEPPAARLLPRLSTLQTLLGQLHDLHVLEGELGRATEDVPRERHHAASSVRGQVDAVPGPRAGLGRLAVLVRTRRDERWRALAKTLGDLAEVEAQVSQLRSALLDRAARDREIERKFLLSALPPRAVGAPVRQIEQGYLPGAVLVERIRRERDTDGVRHWRTVKVGSGLSRTELEEACDAALFDALWPFTEGRRVRKHRYRVQDATGLVWEIDRFDDRDLVLAEVELPAVSAAAPLPEWLAPYVVREVTGEREYVNAVLAS